MYHQVGARPGADDQPRPILELELGAAAVPAQGEDRIAAERDPGADVVVRHRGGLAIYRVVEWGHGRRCRAVLAPVALEMQFRLLDTTYNGEPIQLAVTVVTRAQLVADAGESRARVELIDKPVLYAEMVNGPDAFTGLVLTTLVENTGPKMVGEIVGGIQVPLPALPLDAVADSLAGKQLRIAPPAEFVTGEPPARVTLYGRFAAQ
jgi:hypothetical protein